MATIIPAITDICVKGMTHAISSWQKQRFILTLSISLFATAVPYGVTVSWAKHDRTLAPVAAKDAAGNGDPCAAMTAIAKSHLANAANLQAAIAGRSKGPPPTALAMVDHLLGWTAPDTETPRKLEVELQRVDDGNAVLVSKGCRPVEVNIR